VPKLKSTHRERSSGRGFCAEELEQRVLLAGVTLITAGLDGAGTTNAPSGNTPGGWVYDMANAIAANPNINAAIYRITATDNGSGSGPITISAPTLVAGTAPNLSANPQIILMLDWSALAGGIDIPFLGSHELKLNTFDVRGTVPVAEAVAAALLKPSFVPGISTLGALPFDLIGNGRGGSLVSQLAEDLGESGIWVDQVTTLDPHPVNGGTANFGYNFADSSPRHWSNVMFFDNYWENGNGALVSIAGANVTGAYNVKLNDSILNSAGYPNATNFGPDVSSIGDDEDTYLWYQGTVDPSAGIPSIGSVEGGSNWYNTKYAMGPQTETGYYFSQVVGGVRPASGVASQFDGSAATVPVTTSGPQWPDIGYIQLTGLSTHNVQIGDALDVNYYVQTPDANATITWYLGTNQNPFDNPNPIVLQTSTQGTAGFALVSNVAISTANVPAGDYYVYAEIDDNGLYRYAYIPGEFAFGIAATEHVAISAQPPQTETAGNGFDLIADIEDGDGNVETSDDSNVTLTVASGPSSILSGTVTVQAINGVASFSGISLDTAGTYTLFVSDAGDNVSGTSSNTMVVNPAAASKLAFAAPIANGISPAVVVDIEDRFGNVVTTSDSTIKLAIHSGPSRAKLSGTTSVSAVNGVATFDILSINTSGTFTLKATSRLLEPITSNKFVIL
jgi:hypothetical protein